MKPKACFWKDQQDKPFIRLTKNKREKIQITRIRNERGNITTNFAEIKRIIKQKCEQLYASKLT